MVLLRKFSASNICKSKIEVRFEKGDARKVMRFYDGVHGAAKFLSDSRSFEAATNS